MRSPCVRLILKGQTLAEIPFEGDALRIGRMKENDVVIHNLSVSRFHATLTRDGDTFVIQDSGSENGIYVNGEPHSRAVVGPGDQILIGKHELQICPEGSDDSAGAAPGSGPSDAWDASNTYFVGVDTQAKMLQGAQVRSDADTDGEPLETTPLEEEPETRLLDEDEEREPATMALEVDADLEPATVTSEEAVDFEPETVTSEEAVDLEPATLVAEESTDLEPATVAADDDLEAAPSAIDALDDPDPATLLIGDPIEEEPETALLDARPVDSDEMLEMPEEVEPTPDPTSEYDVGAADLEAAQAAELPAGALDSEDLEARAAPPAAIPEDDCTSADGQYAGLIISRRGRFERVLRWDAERLCLGRAVECDVVLSAAEVSRNHTLLVRDGERYEVRDLESINGTWVNGEKISRRVLEVGDVIRIDEFELTFVLESRPIGDEIVAQAPEEVHAVPSRDAKAFTQLGEMLDLAPFDVGDGNPPAAEAAAMSFDDPPSAEPPTVVIEDDTTDPAAEQSLGGGAGPDVDAKPDEDGVWALEVRVRLEELPEPLREALGTLEDSELRLPVELVLKTREG